MTTAKAMSNNVYPITDDDMHAAVNRVFCGTFWPDDGNLWRAFMHHVDVLEREAIPIEPGSAEPPATLEAAPSRFEASSRP